jgi:hypothetical protein
MVPLLFVVALLTKPLLAISLERTTKADIQKYKR